MCAGGGEQARDDDGAVEHKLPRVELLLRRLTDAHCHPTELDFSDEDVENVRLGTLCAMATTTDDQDRVEALADKWPARADGQTHLEVIACFGHHPWFSHRFTLSSGSSAPSKAEHYTAIWLPDPSAPSYASQHSLLQTLLPYLPEPLSFPAALEKLQSQIEKRAGEKKKWMLGEVGLDRVARVPWPANAPAPAATEAAPRLTPFKTAISHQREMVLQQMECALEVGDRYGVVVHVSLHGVGAAAAVQDVLETMLKRHGRRFTHGMRVDLHSAAGLHPNILQGIQKRMANIYISPSLALNASNAKGVPILKIADESRLLVESDTHDLRLCDERVWGALKWIAQAKGWTWEEAVERLERNWRAFASEGDR